MIQNLITIATFPLLLSITQLNLSQNNINTQNKDYEIIEATTGKNTDNLEYYAEDPVIETHQAAVSAIKKALANEGIDTSKVRIMLYYDPIAIRDDSPPRIWNSKSHPNTVTSPWLDLTKTVTASGETKITIRIDATAARVISDLFSEPEEKDDVGGFLSIPSITESCLFWMTARYTEARFEGGLDPASLYCASKQIRKPLLSLFRLAKPSAGSLNEPVIFEFGYYCQDAAREYYSKLYPRLAVKALQILDNQSVYQSKWWKEVIEKIKPIQECE